VDPCSNKNILNNIIPEPPPPIDRPIFLFQAWFHHKMK